MFLRKIGVSLRSAICHNRRPIYIPALPLEGTIVIHILFVKLENSRINQPFHNECLRYFTFGVRIGFKYPKFRVFKPIRTYEL